MSHQHTICAFSSFYLSLLCLLCFLFFFPFPHAVPKRALQRDKYGSQTKHCLSNVIDFGFAFFSLDADKGVMKTTSFPLEAIQFSLWQRPLTLTRMPVKLVWIASRVPLLTDIYTTWCSLKKKTRERLLPLTCPRPIWYHSLNKWSQLQLTLRFTSTLEKARRYKLICDL